MTVKTLSDFPTLICSFPIADNYVISNLLNMLLVSFEKIYGRILKVNLSWSPT